jgi:hypothetical protein
MLRLPDRVGGWLSIRSGSPESRPYTPQNILATLFHVLGINPGATLADHNGRPQYLLYNQELV